MGDTTHIDVPWALSAPGPSAPPPPPPNIPPAPPVSQPAINQPNPPSMPGGGLQTQILHPENRINDYDLIDKLGLNPWADLVTVTVLAIICGTLIYAVLLKCLSLAYGSVERMRKRFETAQNVHFDLINRLQISAAEIETLRRQVDQLESQLRE